MRDSVQRVGALPPHLRHYALLFGSDRVGITLKPDLVAIKDTEGNPDRFAAVAGKVAESGAGMILMSSSPDVLSLSAP